MRPEYLNRQADIEFGSGQFLHALFYAGSYEEFLRLSPVEQAMLVGWANGCPVTGELTDPNHPDKANRGPNNMIMRYGRVNFWFRQIVRAAEGLPAEDGLSFEGGLNPELAEQLQWPVERSEPAGENIEQSSIPDSFYSEMSPLGTLWGYAASRLLVKRLGSDDLPTYELQRRLDHTLSILKHAVSEARSCEDLLAIIAEEVAGTGEVDPREVLHEVLSVGWYGEHHASSMVDTVKKALRIKARDLWTVYEALQPGEKQKAGILDETSPFEVAHGLLSIEALSPFHNREFGYTLWEDADDPANPNGPKGIIMHVPAGMMSKVWKLVGEDYSERVEVARGSGFISVKRDGSDEWQTIPLNADNPTGYDLQINKGDMFCVVADNDGIVVLSRPSKEFIKTFEKDVTASPKDAISQQVLASVALAKAAI